MEFLQRLTGINILIILLSFALWLLFTIGLFTHDEIKVRKKKATKMNELEKDIQDIKQLNDFISRFEIFVDSCKTTKSDEGVLVFKIFDAQEIIRLMKDHKATKEVIVKWRKE